MHTHATFIDGVLKPDDALPLLDGTRVSVVLEPLADRIGSQKAWKSLQLRIQQRPVHSGGRHFTREELHKRR